MALLSSCVLYLDVCFAPWLDNYLNAFEAVVHHFVVISPLTRIMRIVLRLRENYFFGYQLVNFQLGFDYQIPGKCSAAFLRLFHAAWGKIDQEYDLLASE